MKTIEFDEVCKSCNGTGLYVGIAEKDGAAVICHTCNGTGYHHFKYTYEEFKKRKEIQDIKRVYQVNPVIGNGGNCSLEDFGGISYEDWKKGKEFVLGTENRKYTCPAWWYQTADYYKKPHWDKCPPCGVFSNCKHFKDKDKCWKRFDQEENK